ncbi:MAG: AAA family ATPase [Candidatus Obscuribacterales bacterium]|nr:AAA family ATPase [Candidatus Obscuribacterales bacterium]
MNQEPKTGLIRESFLSQQNSHVYLVDFAQSYADKLFIALIESENDLVTGNQRIQWLKARCPDAQIVLIQPETNSQQLLELLGFIPDFVFGIAKNSKGLAAELGAHFIPIDCEQSIANIDSTVIGQDPLTLQRVCIFGPESTGKSTLTANLAKHFNTVFVPEYARTYIDSNNNELKQTDFNYFARGHIASEKAFARQANRLLFSDTDLIITTIWSDWLYGSCSPWIKEQAEKQNYDLYLLTDVDVPWVADPQRYLPNERQSFLKRCQDELEKRNLPYVQIKGTWEERLQKAITAVMSIMHSRNT